MSHYRKTIGVSKAAPEIPPKTGFVHFHISHGCRSTQPGVRIALWERDFQEWLTPDAIEVAKVRIGLGWGDDA